MGEKIFLNRCHFPVTSLGYGRRVGIWLQGCSIGCAGCIVPETWVSEAKHDVAVEALVDAIRPWLLCAEGVTISGGEPFEQPAALTPLIEGVRSFCTGDVLVYSGFTWSYLRRRYAAIIASIDVLVSGPFIARLQTGGYSLCGSSNQEVHVLTALAKRRYTADVLSPRFVNVAIDGTSIRLAGVLEGEALVEIQRTLRAAGFTGSLTHDPV
jgi:anaerobic ribonucleoside-triphosphate reductase activating protein